jgi:hypothetical protein
MRLRLRRASIPLFNCLLFSPGGCLFVPSIVLVAIDHYLIN